MAERFLHDYPELKPFVLSDVRLTGVTIGFGAHGSVEEVAIPGAICAAKRVHDIFVKGAKNQDAAMRKASNQFKRECQLMSTLRHPNIVQFLGVVFFPFPDSRLPALVMERLLTNLHDLLVPETDASVPSDVSKPFIPLDLKCSILHNVACGLAYLHGRSEPIIHRNLSARKVLLNSGMVAKIADLGGARTITGMREAAAMTKGPGDSLYMPPEANAPSSSNAEMSKYDASIDIFSLGILSIFTIGGNLPCDLLPPNYPDENSGLLVARSELERRSKYLQDVKSEIHASGQLCADHSLMRLIQQCLHNIPHKRPTIHEALGLLEEARAGVGDEGSKRNKLELLQAVHIESKHQEFQHVMAENADLQCSIQMKETELSKVQEQLRDKEEKLTTVLGALTRAATTIRRGQEQIQDMMQHETEVVQAKDRELAQTQRQLRQKEEELLRKAEELQRAEESIKKEQHQMHEMRQRDFELVQSWDRAQQQMTQMTAVEERMKVELQQAHAQVNELQQRVDEIEKTKYDKRLVQEQATAAERRGPSWEVKEDELEVTDETLGCGGWALVKVAKLKVAAKCLHNQLIYDYHRDSFRREMDMAARLCHPNLLRFLGAKLEGDMTILTEFMPISLRALINGDPQQPLSLQHILSIALDVARALNYLHSMTPDPIIHRDLSSANVLLQPSSNGGWLAKVADYGTANFQSLLKTQNPGCPVYNAPESHDPAAQTPKMDIYSFGVLLVEMYTGHLPTVECRAELMKSMYHPGLMNLARQCLNEDKDRRPTAAQVLELLQDMH